MTCEFLEKKTPCFVTFDPLNNVRVGLMDKYKLSSVKSDREDEGPLPGSFQTAVVQGMEYTRTRIFSHAMINAVLALEPHQEW